MGSRGSLHWTLLVHTLLGTLLVASGTATLNQFMERADDARMQRTRFRPLASGRIPPWRGLGFGIILSTTGAAYLAWAVNPLSSVLALLTLLSYLLLYTPLKRRTPLCTLVGAFPGAMPPMIGWAAASGGLSREAWILYAILFLWQFPHFLGIAWLYRRDYARAGLQMLSQRDIEGRFTALEIVGATVALLAVSLVPALLGWEGLFYLLGALLAGVVFLRAGVHMAISRSNVLARRLVRASVIYLPAVLGLMMVDKISW